MASTSAFAGRRSASAAPRRAVSVRAAEDEKKLDFQPSRRSVSGSWSRYFQTRPTESNCKEAASPSVSDVVEKERANRRSCLLLVGAVPGIPAVVLIPSPRFRCLSGRSSRCVKLEHGMRERKASNAGAGSGSATRSLSFLLCSPLSRSLHRRTNVCRNKTTPKKKKNFDRVWTTPTRTQRASPTSSPSR